jgi:tetratricopeptide (TPR) repeat protein
VLHLLASQPGPPHEPGLSVPIFTLEAIANARLQRFPEAEVKLKEAEQICTSWADPSCGEVIQARGLISNEKGQLVQARQVFELSLSFARAHGDRFLESTSLLNLGAVSLKQEHFDEAIESSEASYRVSSAIRAGDVALVAQGNVGWAYYKLGDAEKSLEVFQAAERKAAQLGDIFDQENELTNIGYIYMDSRKFDLAAQSFQRALGLAEGIKAKQDIYNTLRVLARLALQTGDPEASHYAERALAIARESGNHVDELYPLLVQGQVAARRGDAAAAENKFHEVEQDKTCPVFLKWEAEHSLARLDEDEKRPDSAGREYRAALATFEAARDSVRHEDSQLSFLTNGFRIYDDYVHFLVAQGRTDDALRWADYSRARTLAEGLGLLAKGPSTGPPPLNPRQIARRAEGTLLFYWLGEKQSYLWAITPHKTSLFTLPPGSEIDAAVQRYRKALGGPQDVLDSSDQDGRWLYRTLIVPAQALLGARPSGAKAWRRCRSCGTAAEKAGIRRPAPKGASEFEELAVSLKRYPDTKHDAPIRNASFSAASAASPSPDSAFFDAGAKVFIIPDGSLNNLNFETLLVSGPKLSEPKLSEPKLHYWIEDVTIANASSLRVLGASRAGKEKRDRGLLLVGNSVAPNDKYPELPKAAAQMESVARHFPAAEQRIFTREQATPAAYLAGSPERFSYIHFVAHGTASRLSPLDSAIILSKIVRSKTVPAEGNAENDSFKLYARDIIRHPLRADLVTISACYGAGERAYSGEGLVGLSWAFVRAGAHNVVAALWEASDASTEQLMDKFYDELDKGAGPDAALRTAKLSLLRSSGFHNPFYWAPFQLYAGS